MIMRNALDSRELGTIEGFDITAYEFFDQDSTPYDADCYMPEDIEAWRNDEWYYAGVVVVARKEGIELGEASIGGLDTGHYWDRGDGKYREILDDTEGFTIGTPDGDGGFTYRTEITFAHGYGSELISEAIAEARDTLKRLAA